MAGSFIFNTILFYIIYYLYPHYLHYYSILPHVHYKYIMAECYHCSMCTLHIAHYILYYIIMYNVPYSIYCIEFTHHEGSTG